MMASSTVKKLSGSNFLPVERSHLRKLSLLMCSWLAAAAEGQVEAEPLVEVVERVVVLQLQHQYHYLPVKHIALLSERVELQVPTEGSAHFQVTVRVAELAEMEHLAVLAVQVAALALIILSEMAGRMGLAAGHRMVVARLGLDKEQLHMNLAILRQLFMQAAVAAAVLRITLPQESVVLAVEQPVVRDITTETVHPQIQAAAAVVVVRIPTLEVLVVLESALSETTDRR